MNRNLTDQKSKEQSLLVLGHYCTEKNRQEKTAILVIAYSSRRKRILG